MMNSKLVMTVEEMQDRKKWLALRNSGIGGSDAAVILNMNPWKSAFQLWSEKTGQVDPEDLSDNERVYWGTVLEDAVAKRFEELTGKKVRRCGMMQDNVRPYLLASVDRLVIGEEAGLECKTTSAYNKDLWEGDNIPDAYYIQCQHYMMVTGLKKWYIACLIGGQTFVWKEVKRRENDIEPLFLAETKFWKMVQDKTMPDVDGTKNCADILVERFKAKKGKEIMLPSAGNAAVVKLAELKATAKELKNEITLVENELKVMLADAEVGHATGYDITWKFKKGAENIDREKLKKEHPQIFTECVKYNKDTREFKLKKIKKE